MKPKIHPEFHKVNVTCACGNAFESFSTMKEIKVEVCSNCHPFFTGTQRFVDTAGRVERFKAKIESTKAAAAAAKPSKKVKAASTVKPAAPKPAPKGAKPAPKTDPAEKNVVASEK